MDDVNLALTTNKIEPIYGLHLLNNNDPLQEEKSSAVVASSSSSTQGIINVSEYANSHPLPPCPLLPSISLHWLAVKGVQPAVSENPTFVENEPDHHHLLLPKELQVNPTSNHFLIDLLLIYSGLIVSLCSYHRNYLTI